MRGLKPRLEPMRHTSMCHRVKMPSLHQQLRRLSHSRLRISNCSISSYRSQLDSTIRQLDFSQACSRSPPDIQCQIRAYHHNRLGSHRIHSQQATMGHVRQCLQCQLVLPTICPRSKREEFPSKHSRQVYLANGASSMHRLLACQTFKLFNNS